MAGDGAADAPPRGETVEGRQRVDRWLWAARFFKTRGVARRAIDAGKVRVNGDRAKPARTVGAGDHVHVVTPGAVYGVEVLALNAERRPAAEARRLYRETEDSRAAREREAEAARERRAAVVFDRDRPDRRSRREAIRLRKRRD